MPQKKSSKNKKYKPIDAAVRELLYKEEMQDYAIVKSLRGDRRLDVMLTDGTTIMAIIPGKMRKRVWIKAGDVILVSFRDFQEGKVDVIYKYDKKEIDNLMLYGELPTNFLSSDTDIGIADDNLVFEDGDEEDKIDIDDI